MPLRAVDSPLARSVGRTPAASALLEHPLAVVPPLGRPKPNVPLELSAIPELAPVVEVPVVEPSSRALFPAKPVPDVMASSPVEVPDPEAPCPFEDESMQLKVPSTS